MIAVSDKLIGTEVTLVCFGEYVGFIHFGESVHCRIESEAVIRCENGNESLLFPYPAQGALPLILGTTVENISIDDSFRIQLNNGVLIQATLNVGYESVIVDVHGKSEVLLKGSID